MCSDYRITSADFITPSESLIPDAILSPEDIANTKQQTGGIDAFLQAQIKNKDLDSNPNTITLIREKK